MSEAGTDLKHYGVKGMKWGIRNDRETSGYRLQAAGPKIDSNLHQSTQTAGKNVASLMGERYGFHISALKTLGPGHPEYELGTVGFVESTPGKRGGDIYVRKNDFRKDLKDAEKIGWFANGCGNTHAFLTHESAHALFHAEQEVRPGFLAPKIVGGNIKARDAALKAATREAKREGIPSYQFSTKVSGYSAASGMREEMEAELFSQYHWNPNPPQFVKVWGETLHQEMGINSTPFREEVKLV